MVRSSFVDLGLSSLCSALETTDSKLADHITQDQWAAKYQEAQVRPSSPRSRHFPHLIPTLVVRQATATRATKLELDREYDAAFTAYIAAAQTYLFLVRHTVDPDSKTKFRAVSAKLVERAERIKAARKVDIKPLHKDPLSLRAFLSSSFSSSSAS